MSEESLEPRKRPCASCPYRRDVPSGVWSAEEYAKLEQYDRPTYDQPQALFSCHQDDGHLCSGWVAVHGDQLLSLRLAVSSGRVDPSVFDYRTTIPLHPSGRAACMHGLRDLFNPSPKAIEMSAKIVKKRSL